MSETGKKVKQFVIVALRRASLRWPGRYLTQKKARVERGKYLCNMCKQIHRRKDIVVDHVLPVVDPKVGWEGFDSFIMRLFCKEEGFQVLCRPCHQVKNKLEGKVRVRQRRKKKNE